MAVQVLKQVWTLDSSLEDQSGDERRIRILPDHNCVGPLVGEWCGCKI